MESQLTRIGLDFERLSAVDGKRLSTEQLNGVDRLDPRSELLSDGAVAAFLSHLEVWKLIAAGTEEYAVVMEDDVYISKHAGELLSDPSWIPIATPLIKLETTFGKILFGRQVWSGHLGEYQFKLLEYTLRRTDGREGGHGAGCYILNKRFASWLVKHFTKISWHVDAEMVRLELFQQPSTNPFRNFPLQLVPAIAVQQLCSNEMFLPPGAEVSTFDHRQRIKSNPSTIHVVIRELSRIFHKHNLQRRLFGQRVPLLRT